MRDRELGRDPRPHSEFLRLEPLLKDDKSAQGCWKSDKEAGVAGEARHDWRETGPPPDGEEGLWVNTVDGMVRSTAPSRCRPVRGGMLCDEPGLGKTITVLALLLKTRGLLPGGRRAGSGSEWVVAELGRGFGIL